MGNVRFDSISDYYRHGYDLRVACSCGHVAVIDTLALTEECSRRKWGRRIELIEARLKCSKCGRRDVECSPTLRDD